MNKWELLNSYRKNKDDIKSIILRLYPDFVFKSIKELPEGEIPIFTFHSVESYKFEYLIKYLADNNYRTISSDDYYNFLIGKYKVKSNTIMLTFDDGLGSLWSVAYPILKKYGLKATSFLLPAVMKEEFGYLPNLDDLWAGKTTPEEIDKREKIETFCSWQEVRIMQNSGVIDFQSHSYDHHSIFKNAKLVDFMNPLMNDSFLTGSFKPIIRTNESEFVPEKLELGYPIYSWGANLGESKRFLEDEVLSKKCVDYVKNNGGIDFFSKNNWKHELTEMYKNFQSIGNNGIYQSEEKRFDDMKNDLYNSKISIERKINNEVKHLCYPWGLGSDLAVQASKEVGYYSNFWCQLNRKLIMNAGENPYYIPRIVYEDYILSLPGKKRISFLNQLKNKFDNYVLKKKVNFNN